jgi:allophanate hydrolase subunit 1
MKTAVPPVTQYWLSAQALNLEGRRLISRCAGGEHATDLESYVGILVSAREVIRRHSLGVYTVVALGSAPGFAISMVWIASGDAA